MRELKIILASNSPRRKELLGLAMLPFTVDSADVDETVIPGEKPEEYVRRLALAKAGETAGRYGKDSIVLGSDTTVVLNDEIIGKPIDEADAARILIMLRGRSHQVYTGIAAVNIASGTIVSRVIRTDVPMRAYTSDEMSAYIASGDPMDKAGAYGIQNSDFVAKTELSGCYASVMGFPICAVASMLMASGIQLEIGIEDRCQKLIGYDCPVFPNYLIQ